MENSKLWKAGNSVVLTVPPELLREYHLKVGEKVGFMIFKKHDLKEWFGEGRHLNINAQKAKNYMRKQW